MTRISVQAALITGAARGQGQSRAIRLSGVRSAAPSPLPDFAPVPEEALAGPKLNENGYYVGRIKGNLYWVTDASYQAMFLTTAEGVVLVDAPPTIGHNLLRAIREVTRANGRPRKVTHLIYTHSHADHIGAAAIFGKRVVRIAHTETRRLLNLHKDPNRPAPDVTFDDRYTLEVGGERLELAYHGPNHSHDNIFVYAPRQKTLMVVDVFYPGWVPWKNFAVAQDVPGYVRAHEIAMSYPWTTLVNGHLGRLGSRTDVAVQQQYIADLQVSARNTITFLDPAPFIEKYGPTGNAWAVSKAYMDAASRQTADPVIAKYTGKLAGVDVFTFDNAFTMVESTRIDPGLLGPFGTRP